MIICSVIATSPLPLGTSYLEVQNDTDYIIFTNYKVANITIINSTNIAFITIKDDNQTTNTTITPTTNYTHPACTKYLYITLTKLTDEPAPISIQVVFDQTGNFYY